MTNTIVYSLFLAILLALTVGLIFYLSIHPDYLTAQTHKAGALLLYHFQKLGICLSYSFHAAKLKLSGIFGNYPIQEEHRQLLSQKEQHLSRLKAQTNRTCGAYGKKEYNLKLLK